MRPRERRRGGRRLRAGEAQPDRIGVVREGRSLLVRRTRVARLGLDILPAQPLGGAGRPPLAFPAGDRLSDWVRALLPPPPLAPARGLPPGLDTGAFLRGTAWAGSGVLTLSPPRMPPAPYLVPCSYFMLKALCEATDLMAVSYLRAVLSR